MTGENVKNVAAPSLRASDALVDPPTTPPPVHICDSIQSLAVHNGVARVCFNRLSPDGVATPSLELLIPVPALPQVIEALRRAG